MKIYSGIKQQYSITITVTDDVANKEYTLSPEPSQKLYNHSPDGFEWGYGGSGPSQLALAILLDCIGKKAALDNYQEFKSQYVARWPKMDGTCWAISEAEIRDWLELDGLQGLSHSSLFEPEEDT